MVSSTLNNSVQAMHSSRGTSSFSFEALCLGSSAAAVLGTDEIACVVGTPAGLDAT